MKVFGFKLKHHIIDVEAKTEKKAYKILLNKFGWLLKSNEKFEWLGELTKQPNNPTGIN